MNIVILIPFTDKQKILIEKQAPNENFIYCKEAEVTKDLLGEADIIFGNPSPELLKYAKKLKWLQLRSAGVNTYTGILPEGVILTSSSGAYGLTVSEHLLAMLFSLYRKMNLYRDNQNLSIWKDEGAVKSICGSTALVVGLGDIGYEFAKKIKLLGGYTIGICRNNDQKKEYIDEIHLISQIDKLLPHSDIVALCLPSTNETHHIIDKKRLKLMKKDSVLLNAGRGDAVDVDALCEVLEQSQIGGAGLDVTEPEPLPKSHRLWNMPQTIITPHIAGGFNLPQTLQCVAEICAKNLYTFVTIGSV